MSKRKKESHEQAASLAGFPLALPAHFPVHRPLEPGKHRPMVASHHFVLALIAQLIEEASASEQNAVGPTEDVGLAVPILLRVKFVGGREIDLPLLKHILEGSLLQPELVLLDEVGVALGLLPFQLR